MIVKINRMRKSALFVAMGSLLAFASCDSGTDMSNTDAIIDSTVDARVEEIRMDLMRQNDSIIHAMAIERADSIMSAAKSTPTRARKPTSSSSSSTTPTEKAEEPKEPTNTGKRSGDTRDGVNTGKRSGDTREGTNTGKR